MKRVLLIALLMSAGLGSLICVRSFVSFEHGFDQSIAAQSQESKFRFLFGDFMGDYATYTFQTPPDEKNFANDCIGCEQEVGNASVFAEFGCPKKTRYLFKSNSEGGVIEKGKKYGKDGAVLGERAVIVFKSKADGKITGARIFWTEGSDFWLVQAPSLELTKELETGKEYDFVRKKVDEERKSYVPIQNANTIKKKKSC